MLVTAKAFPKGIKKPPEVPAHFRGLCFKGWYSMDKHINSEMKTQYCVCLAIKNGSSWEKCNEKDKDASHTYCPKCSAKVRAEINKLKAAKQYVSQQKITDRKSTRLNSSHRSLSRMPSSA